LRSPPDDGVARRRLILVAAALVLLAAAALALYHLSRARCFVPGGEVVCRVETTAPLVALTFDDGPSEAGVTAVLPVLERHGATATFFLVGRGIEARPDLAARLKAAGHEIANHSYSHKRMIGRPSGWYDREIARTEALLAEAGGSAGLFRPPYGKKLFGLPAAVSDAGLTIVTWDVEEPQAADPAAYAESIVAQARPGSIILMHPMYGANGTARAALPLVLEGLARKGLRPVSVGELLAGAQSAEVEAGSANRLRSRSNR
jgi:peptidoglycan/xylan/chitin deacetylase (PgdA/CDA1 family)